MTHDSLAPEQLSDEVRALLGENGPFARSLSRFKVREGQLAMAEAVAQCVAERSCLLVEAGTGTGKTLAYLVPALVAGVRTIVSTGTKALQEQLYQRDLPTALRALDKNVAIAMLKGRSNYLCLYRLQQTMAEGMLASRELVAELQAVREWSTSTTDGDLGAHGPVTDGSPLLPLVTSNSDNCLGSACPDYERCFVVKAREKAQKADVLVVNHHLLLADLTLKEEGFAELLPLADAIVFDEAHQLPDVARHFLGRRFSSRQLEVWISDLKAELLTEAPDAMSLLDAAQIVAARLKDVRLAIPGETGERWPWSRVSQHRGFWEGIRQTGEAFGPLLDSLEQHRARSPGLESLYARARWMQDALAEFERPGADGFARWLEIHQKSFGLVEVPVDIGSLLMERLQSQSQAAWIFTSATLSVAGTTDHFQKAIGLEGSRSLCIESPFNYQEQACLYIPRHLPEPNDKDATHTILAHARALFRESRGRAFVLLTSHRALELARHVYADVTDHTMLFQGDAPKMTLLERFTAEPSAVLVATGSFWEGVDVPGPDLSLVVIDRLPFASPSDPLLQARLQWARQKGEDPFRDIQLAQAVLALKQGAGRLIRSETDTGVLAVLDPRLVSRRYGKDFVSSLPPFRRTRNLSEVNRLLRTLKEEEAHALAGH
jgi:ATP-dependent DNA helicase DinG